MMLIDHEIMIKWLLKNHFSDMTDKELDYVNDLDDRDACLTVVQQEKLRAIVSRVLGRYPYDGSEKVGGTV